MDEIHIEPAGPRRFEVQVTQGGVRTSHKVAVPVAMAAALGLPSVDDVEVVLASFEFLLEREPATSILAEFSLEKIGTYFGEYLPELRSRLGG